jgi:hypothetical protein
MEGYPLLEGLGCYHKGRFLALAGACVMSRMYNVLISIAGNANCDDFELGPRQSSVGANVPATTTHLTSTWGTDIQLRVSQHGLDKGKRLGWWFLSGKGGCFHDHA